MSVFALHREKQRLLFLAPEPPDPGSRLIMLLEVKSDLLSGGLNLTLVPHRSVSVRKDSAGMAGMRPAAVL